jgi:DNA helicase-2/ATP-dependent DNA helicase PcrA
VAFLQLLNTVQQQAVSHINGPVIVIAGAGSGKTRVLTYRTAFLIQQGIRPHEILVLTFTNKAANEMKSRIIELVGEQSKYVQMGTFHSVFAKILRYECEPLGFNRNFSIYDTDDSQQLIKIIMGEKGISTQQFKPSAFRAMISKAKNGMLSPKEFQMQARGMVEEKVGAVYEEYQARLHTSNAMDFDDLLIKPIELFSRSPKVLAKYQERLKFVLVDEYQDTNRIQYVLVKMLAEKYRNVCVVGDDAQSIYSFRGADIRNILDFQKDYPETVIYRLEQNYRSTKNILHAANEVIKNNTGQIPKKLWTDNYEGEIITLLACEDDREEGEMIVHKIKEERRKRNLELKQFAVLYRTNAQSRSLEEALRRENIPYVIVGGVEFYRRKEIKDVLAYLRVLVNPKDSESLSRIINYPARGIGETALEKISAFAQLHTISLFEALQRLNEVDGIQTRTRNAIKNFLEMIWKYINLKEQVSANELARAIVNEISVLKELKEEGTIESLARWENIQELLSAISEFTDENESPTLEQFLQEIALIADVDKTDTTQNNVTLMTLHAAKGLEFPVVFIAGVEEGLLPLMNGFVNGEDIEEERRLMYVGITRAMKKLYLTTVNVRYRFGDSTYATPSRFIAEINEQYLQREQSRRQKIFTGVAQTRQQFYVRKNRSQFNDTDKQEFPDYENETQIMKPKKLTIGMRVTHDVFGKGKIVHLTGAGESERAIVDFDTIGRKQLLVKFAQLIPIAV